MSMQCVPTHQERLVVHVKLDILETVWFVAVSELISIVEIGATLMIMCLKHFIEHSIFLIYNLAITLTFLLPPRNI